MPNNITDTISKHCSREERMRTGITGKNLVLLNCLWITNQVMNSWSNTIKIFPSHFGEFTEVPQIRSQTSLSNISTCLLPMHLLALSWGWSLSRVASAHPAPAYGAFLPPKLQSA